MWASDDGADGETTDPACGYDSDAQRRSAHEFCSFWSQVGDRQFGIRTLQTAVDDERRVGGVAVLRAQVQRQPAEVGDIADPVQRSPLLQFLFGAGHEVEARLQTGGEERP